MNINDLGSTLFSRFDKKTASHEMRRLDVSWFNQRLLLCNLFSQYNLLAAIFHRENIKL